MANTLPKEYYTKLEEIQAADFVVLELINLPGISCS